MIRDYYVTPKSSKVMRLLWKVAGGDRFLLEKATYSDQIKYMCLGGIVLATGVMAALAGGYAFYTIFEPKGNALDQYSDVQHTAQSTKLYLEHTDISTAIKATFFGIIWGLIIFNIDRFIVTSTGKGDGTEAITLDELKSAIPRIIMGAIIALTISKPIEIRMFKSEIDAALQHVQDSVRTVNIQSAEKNYEENIKEAKKKLGKIEVDRQVKKDRLRFLDSMISFETSHGDCKTKCQEFKSQKIITEDELKQIESSPEYLSNIKEDSIYTAKLDEDKQNAEKTSKALDGLLIRIKLAHETAGWIISLFITLLFMAIELTPIFFKLMLIKTPYDYMDENTKELMRAENGIEVRYNFYEDKQGQERHLVINHEAERLIYEKKKATEAQKELIDHALQKYIEKQKAEIDKNPDDYVA